MRTRTAVSAGGVIVTGDGSVVVTARRSFKGQLQWGFPKGTVEEGESTEEAAAREAREETGLEVEVLEPLKTIDYWYVEPAGQGGVPTRVHKYVHYFLMQRVGGDPTAHDRETEEVVFLDPQSALDRISFKSEKALLKDLVDETAP